MTPAFPTFFSAATGKPAPYDYQKRLACGERQQGQSESDWLSLQVRVRAASSASPPASVKPPPLSLLGSGIARDQPPPK